VPLQRQLHVASAHPAAVVDHFNAVDAARCETDRDPPRPRVDRILDQFLQRAGRSFDHLTGCDSVYQMFREAPY
jgi:hypothetical protein